MHVFGEIARLWDITRRRVVIVYTRRRVISQKGAGLINIAAEAWNQGYAGIYVRLMVVSYLALLRYEVC
jgi:hypothetical protein